MKKEEQEKIEEILFSYNFYLEEVKELKALIKNPQLIHEYRFNFVKPTGYIDVKSETEVLESYVKWLKEELLMYEKMLFKINQALKKVKKEKYYEMIKLIYIDKLTYEEIADKLSVSRQTVNKRKLTILSKLVVLFKIQGLM